MYRQKEKLDGPTMPAQPKKNVNQIKKKSIGKDNIRSPNCQDTSTGEEKRGESRRQEARTHSEGTIEENAKRDIQPQNSFQKETLQQSFAMRKTRSKPVHETKKRRKKKGPPFEEKNHTPPVRDTRPSREGRERLLQAMGG